MTDRGHKRVNSTRVLREFLLPVGPGTTARTPAEASQHTEDRPRPGIKRSPRTSRASLRRVSQVRAVRCSGQYVTRTKHNRRPEADQRRITRGMPPARARPGCNDDAAYCTDGTRRAGLSDAPFHEPFHARGDCVARTPRPCSTFSGNRPNRASYAPAAAVAMLLIVRFPAIHVLRRTGLPAPVR